MSAVSLVMKMLFYEHLPPNLKKDVQQILLFWLLFARRMKLSISGETAILSKGNQKVILNKDDHLLITAWYFDKLFRIPELRPKNGETLDFISGISVFGYDIITTPLAVLEIKDAIMAYNARHSVSEGDIIFDCGAYHGLYALYISKKVGNLGKIFCLEPDPENFKILSENIKRNGLINIYPVMVGLWSESTTLSFICQKTGSCVSKGESTEQTIKIKVSTLADFFKKQKLAKIDFIKMDIEGAEVEVLASSEDFIEEFKPTFAIASYHVRDGKKTAYFLESYFHKYKYEYITENPAHPTTYAWSKEKYPRKSNAPIGSKSSSAL